MTLLGSDGVVRLTLNEVLSIKMVHLLSGIDEALPGDMPMCGTATSLTGYTEWRSLAAPVIVIGWDWTSIRDGDQIRLARVGPPRSNIVLVDHTREDMAWQRQQEILGTVVDAMDWGGHTQATVVERYR